MPLMHGKSKKAFNHNIRAEIRAHKASGGCIGEGCEHYSHGGAVKNKFSEIHEKQTAIAKSMHKESSPEQKAKNEAFWKTADRELKTLDPTGKRPGTFVGEYAAGGVVEEEPMYSAKALSESIRMKRKKIKEDGVENMVDTAPAPQMNPGDILNLKQEAQMHDSMDLPEKSTAPSDPADATEDDSQSVSALKKKMSRIAKILGTLSIG